MAILERLRRNKGTVSTELGKKLAKEVLGGKADILEDAVELSSYSLHDKKERNVRSGASKIVELVAMEKPELVAPHLERLLPALEAAEPQTRWMTIRTMGLCARLAPETARRALPFAKEYIRAKKDGQLCLASSADLYLGDFGAVSPANAKLAFPVLLESTDNVIMNEHDWLFEAFLKLAPHLSKKEKETIVAFAAEYADHPRKKTQERVKRIVEILK